MGPTIRLAQETGASVVVMHTPRSESLESGEGIDFRRSIERWQPQLTGSRLCLAVENKNIRTESQRRYVLSPLERLRAFADYYDLGLVLDTTHAGTAGVDLVQARRTFDGRLVNVHLSDVGGRRAWARLPRIEMVLREHRFPGAGELRLVPLLADLAAAGYDGPVTLEVNPLELQVWWPPAVRRRLARALGWMRKAAGSSSGAGQSAGNPEAGPTP
jgi:sugar phosphate isomerase/epimerase